MHSSSSVQSQTGECKKADKIIKLCVLWFQRSSAPPACRGILLLISVNGQNAWLKWSPGAFLKERGCVSLLFCNVWGPRIASQSGEVKKNQCVFHTGGIPADPAAPRLLLPESCGHSVGQCQPPHRAAYGVWDTITTRGKGLQYPAPVFCCLALIGYAIYFFQWCFLEECIWMN